MFFGRQSCSVALALATASLTFASGYGTHNLVSDGFIPADHTDPNLVNPWGISYAPNGPFWVSDNGTGLSTLYNGSGTPQSLVVNIQGAGGSGNSPATGQVFNGITTDFLISSGGKSGSSKFLFASEDGTISGWNPSVDLTASHVVIDNSASRAKYKGLAIGSDAGNQHLYAANFTGNAVEMYDRNYALTSTFTDPNVPSGFSPFNTQVLGNSLYVTYALKGATGDDVSGLGNGYVDRFNLDGSGLTRLVSNGDLNSPWGLAIAPSGFGALSGDLLVGNFGDGRIHAYDPITGAPMGAMVDSLGNPIQIDGLWGLIPGNGASAGDANRIYFSAGSGGEAHGLFGEIAPVPEPASLLALGSFALVLIRRKRS